MILFCNSQKVFPSSICIGCKQKIIPMICKKLISLIIFMVAVVSRVMTLILFVSLRMKCCWIDLHIIYNIILISLISIKSSIARLYHAFFVLLYHLTFICIVPLLLQVYGMQRALYVNYIWCTVLDFFWVPISSTNCSTNVFTIKSRMIRKQTFYCGLLKWSILCF